jgi:outer membrane protein OmpA-like peptidoglycan-associated protein
MKSIVRKPFLLVAMAFFACFSLKASEIQKDSLKDIGFDINFLLKSVKFVGNTDQFSPNYATSIDKVIDLMAKKKNLKVRISAHVDKSLIQTKKVAADLTKKRAEAIKKYMITKGIAADRILALGYNGTRPKDSLTKTIEINNRVEAAFKRQETESGFTKPFIFENVKFSSSSDTIFSSSYPAIDRFIKQLNINQQIHIKIYGHVISAASEDYNLKLSVNRANAVKNYMVSQKIAPERIEVEGFGDQFPIAIDETDEAKEYNNRVEISFRKTGATENTPQASVLTGVNFMPNSSELTKTANISLDKFADLLAKQSDKKTLISVFYTKTENADLAKKRAEEIKKYLVGKRIPASKIETEALPTTDATYKIEVKFK